MNQSNLYIFQNNKGFSLIEVLISISIAAILLGVTLFTLKTTVETYTYLQEDVFVQKHLDEMLQVLSEGGFDNYGIKSSLEILDAGEDFIRFVPPWVDDVHFSVDPNQLNKEFILNRPFRAGSSVPVAEVLERDRGKIRRIEYPIGLNLDDNRVGVRPFDRVFFLKNPPPGLKINFIYHPAAEFAEDTIMNFRFKEGKIERRYKKKSDYLPKDELTDIKLLGMKLQYYDNANEEILPAPKSKRIKRADIANITAVKLSLSVEFGNLVRTGSVYMNLRNTRGSGVGLIVRKGTEIRLPSSQDVKNFSLVNIQGPQRGGRIVLEAVSEQGRSWRVKIDLDKANDLDIIRSYTVQYPIGQNVFYEVINLTTDLPLNFMTLGGTGRYDYDDDEGDDDVVDLPGVVTLRVVEMDAAGASLFVRP